MFEAYLNLRSITNRLKIVKFQNNFSTENLQFDSVTKNLIDHMGWHWHHVQKLMMVSCVKDQVHIRPFRPFFWNPKSHSLELILNGWCWAWLNIRESNFAAHHKIWFLIITLGLILGMVPPHFVTRDLHPSTGLISD